MGPLGEGSQGRTFDGIDKREGRAVAIKRFDVRGARAWKDVELAEREARVLGSLSHPKLPAYIDHFEEDGALYLVMEKIEGETLAAIRKRGGVLSENDILRFLRDAAEVLAYLHNRAPPVIHRDLKPGNVIRRPDGSFAFVDFGAVRDKLKPEGGSTVVGTFGYMAPEQFQGRALPASDVYAIGATALTMLTGEDPENLPHKGLAIDVRASLRGRGNQQLVNILEQMLDPDPDKRASSIATLLGRAPPQKSGWERDLEDAARSIGERIEREAREFERRSKAEHRRYKEEERERKRERREARHRQHRGMSPWPFPLALAATIALTVAIPVVAVVMQFLLPLIFGILGIFFRRMDVPARAVRNAGEVAVGAMQRAKIAVQKGITPPRAEEQPRMRVEPGDAPRVRVVDTTTVEDEADEEERIEERKRAKK
jgi:serine/threonine protein kinase